MRKKSILVNRADHLWWVAEALREILYCFAHLHQINLHVLFVLLRCSANISAISFVVVASSSDLSSRINPITRGNRNASPLPCSSSAAVWMGERVISSASTVTTNFGSIHTSGPRRESTRAG